MATNFRYEYVMNIIHTTYNVFVQALLHDKATESQRGLTFHKYGYGWMKVLLKELKRLQFTQL